MSSPNAFASFSIFKGDITTQDFMHLVRESDGSVVGWIDQNGTPQGTLAVGGGAGTTNVPWADIADVDFTGSLKTISGNLCEPTGVTAPPTSI